MRRIAAFTLFCMMPMAAVADGFAEFNELPVLPVSAIQQADQAAKTDQQKLAMASPAQDVQQEGAVSASASSSPVNTLHQIAVTPGVNEVIPISVGHTNRIMMPFDTPRIRTTSNATFDVEGRAVYVTSSDEGSPVTAFVSEAGDPETALSLTFVPKRIPPVEVDISIEGDHGVQGYRSTKKAKAWEQAQPYVDALRNVLREVAIGKTPQGYSLSEKPDARDLPGCQLSGVTFDFIDGQVLKGHQLQVNVGVMQNRSDKTIEFREPACSGDDVRAVAAWPHPLLEPGQKSEVYVVRGIEEPQSTRYDERRSLLEE